MQSTMYSDCVNIEWKICLIIVYINTYFPFSKINKIGTKGDDSFRKTRPHRKAMSKQPDDSPHHSVSKTKPNTQVTKDDIAQAIREPGKARPITPVTKEDIAEAIREPGNNYNCHMPQKCPIPVLLVVSQEWIVSDDSLILVPKLWFRPIRKFHQNTSNILLTLYMLNSLRGIYPILPAVWPFTINSKYKQIIFLGTFDYRHFFYKTQYLIHLYYTFKDWVQLNYYYSLIIRSWIWASLCHRRRKWIWLWRGWRRRWQSRWSATGQ